MELIGSNRINRRVIVAGLFFSLLMTGVLFTDVDTAIAGGGPNVTGAKLYIQQNDLVKAESVLLKEITEANENNEDAWYLLGYIYARQKKYDEMLKHFDRAVALKEKFKSKGVKIGKDSGSQFHSKEGVDKILRIIWGNAFNSGVKAFNQAVQANDDSSRAQNYEAAINSFKAAATIQPDSAASYQNWAAALMNSGKNEESIVPLKTALEKSPNDGGLIKLLASVYLNTGNDSLAIPLLEKAWESAPDEEIADFLSRAYVRAGRTGEAREIYIKAIQTSPNSYHFRYNYGTILLEAGEYDEAIVQFEKAYEIDPESSDILYNFGAAYLNRGVHKREAVAEGSEDKAYLEDFEKAFPYLERSLKMNPDDTNSWFSLGRIAGQLNKNTLAGYAFAKGEPVKKTLGEKLIVGMPSDMVKTIFGDPDNSEKIESDTFGEIEEWLYKKSAKVDTRVRVYVVGGRVDALMVE